MTHECPTCDFTSEASNGVAIHHYHAHGESIAKSTYECDLCGNDFDAYDCNVTGEKTFCSRECTDKHREELPPEEHPRWNGGKPTVECTVCGSKKKVKSYRVERSENFFCGQECYAEWQSENLLAEGNPNFDSIEVQCDWCEETILKNPSRVERSKRDFCSHECHSAWESENLVGENSPHWEGGRRDYGPGWHEKKREAVRERDGRECTDCGLSEEQSVEIFGRKLDVHHLTPPTPNTNPAVHNAKRNLVTLCIPCHQRQEKEQTPTDAVAASMEVTNA